jgi:acyl-coenzyme A synthetase/AMP-(fatty) acid ligase/acyl carrier protein
VEVLHRGLSNLVKWHNSEFGIQARDRATQVANVGFDAAVWEVWPYLAAGASIWFVPEDTVRQPCALQQFLVSRRITVAYTATAVAEALMTMHWPEETALRVLLTGGDVLQTFPRRDLPFAVVNNYGPTECSVVATSGPVSPDSAGLGRPSIGRPIRNTTIHLLDESMRPVPLGDPGEIYIGGEPVARGYRNSADLTSTRFVPDPFSSEAGKRLYRTGDIACQLRNGSYEFIGRIDDQIKIRGYRIEPNEVAAGVNRHPNVQASAVACHTTPAGDKQLVAYVVPVNGARLTHSDLHSCAAATLPAYMTPSVFVRLDSFPLTDRGKVDRNALPPPDRGNTIRDDDNSAVPATATQDRLERIIAELLHLPKVEAGDNFFMLGGHSLLGAQLLVGIQKAFGVQLTLRQLFEAPTPVSLARCIEGAAGQAGSSEAAA